MALSFNSPTPRRLRRPDHPNLFLLGLALKLISSFYLFLQEALPAGQGRAGQGRAGQTVRAGGQRGGPGGPGGRQGAQRFGTEVGFWRRPAPVQGLTWVLPPPWLWRGGQAYWA